jgi:hypothetical protein
MTTLAKKPYHKKRHPWKNQDLRSDAKRAAGPRPVAPSPLCALCGLTRRAPRHVRADISMSYHPFEASEYTTPETATDAVPLCIEIVESATGAVEKKLGPFATERLRDKADDGLTRQLDHARFYTRFVP